MAANNGISDKWPKRIKRLMKDQESECASEGCNNVLRGDNYWDFGDQLVCILHKDQLDLD